ncbi:hypothetical protein [Nitrososphaera sp. AFS]|uniref:hypothetical protein n=1 Tax=Nitrososphaera sp. AFS TaxID=2301191 RepID=UPI0013923AAE|nr:hypothetical protein [Nitrososphaera sp. AFS]NAL78598.1 hypothetical protein [Nitrososphaera sp. AFS]
MPFVVVGITGASIHDMKATINTLDAVIVQRPSCKHVNRIYAWIDKGYDFPEIEKEDNSTNSR